MGNSPGLFAILKDSVGALLYYCLGSHRFSFHLEEVKESLDQKLMMGEMNIPPNSVVIGHEYHQRARAKWQGKYYLHCHIYLILDTVLLKDIIAFAYGSRRSKAAKDEDENAEEKEDSSKVVLDSESKEARSTITCKQVPYPVMNKWIPTYMFCLVHLELRYSLFSEVMFEPSVTLLSDTPVSIQ